MGRVQRTRFDDLAKEGAYYEPYGNTGRKLGTLYHLFKLYDQIVIWKYRGNSNGVSKDHLGVEISKGARLKTR